MKILLLTKENNWCTEAQNWLKKSFGEDNVLVFSSNERYKKIPSDIFNVSGDLLISFLPPWIVPKEILNRFSQAINFHPGPPEYPGAGCYNFALYEEAKEYGVTCHHITPEIDAGPIIKVTKFPIYKFDTVESLRNRTLSYLLVLFYKIMDIILSNKELPLSEENWTRKALTRKDIEKLCEITPDIPPNEIKKRIRAVTYPGMPGAYIFLDGYKFTYKEKNE